ncbi:MAG TPA: TolC family protein, partial [Longimicrobiales bacterium]|nr:TolC family protein [Longimicrobiales bacterium]
MNFPRPFHRRAGALLFAIATTFIALLAAPMAAPAQVAGDSARTVSLEEAVELALEHHPGVVSADASATSARAGQLQARGAWLPSVNANGVYGNSSNQRFDQSTGQLVSENYTAQLRASYELFSGGRRVTSMRAASAQVDAADAMARASRFDAVLAAKRAYYAAAAAADLLRVARQRVERAREQFGFAETRYDVGTATTSDLLRAEIELANAELAEVEAEVALRGAGLVLGRATG